MNTQHDHNGGQEYAKVTSQVLVAAHLLIVAVPVQATTLMQVFPCTINEGYAEKDLTDYVAEYLQTARTIKGREYMEICMNFAVAPQNKSINIVAIYPSFAAWGQ